MSFEGDSPVDICKPIERMKRIYDRLLLLNYETEFIKITKIRPIHRLYFVIPTNPGEQFYNFVSLSAWLIKKCGKHIQMPDESDDPNKVISSILDHVRNLGGLVDFSPSRVKSGCGPNVLTVLDFLTSGALKANRIEWKSPLIKADGKEEEEGEGEDEQEVNLDKIEEELDAIYSDEEETELIYQGDLSTSNSNKVEEQKILTSDTDAEYWRLEVERVLPQLKIQVNTDGQDWRLRQDQMKNWTKGVRESKELITGPLERIISDSSSISEKVSTREKFLNHKFEHILSELSESQKKLGEDREKLRLLSSELGARNKILNQLNEDLEGTRKNLEDRGNIMGDGAPVVAVRKALLQVRKDVADMTVEIGCMQTYILKSLLQQRGILRDKTSI